MARTMRRMLDVRGLGERTNDIITLIRSATKLDSANAPNSTVVFFGGDVQDFSENMLKQRDGQRYIDWNLEDTARLIGTKFPSSNVVVIKPKRMELLIFSCYDNFVQCNGTGVPNHEPMYHALDHMEKILEMVDEQASESSLILIGFSKGCVVLNQFLYEFHHLSCSDVQKQFVARIKEMYWLDGGHNGGKNIFITDKPILKTLSQLSIKVNVHVTPYQVKDHHRPWIGKEEKLFTDSLKRLGAHVERKLHFADVAGDLNMHFNVMNVFK